MALVIEGEPTTYGELEDAVGRVAAGLRAAGVEAGDRVPLADDMSVLATATVIACARIGAAAALMNPRLVS